MERIPPVIPMENTWNLFRYLADLSHITAKSILIFSIHRNRSAEGVSLLTQGFYALVFLTRYTDLFHDPSDWNFFFKVFYILSSVYTISVMRFVYPRTREREVAWKLSAGIFLGSLLLSPFVMLIFVGKDSWSFREWLWVFSQVLESVAVLPQLLLLRQTTIPTVITSFYIVFLGSYRALYVVNWFIRGLDASKRPPNSVSVIFGLIQTALYLDFAWVYWTRQRVKLRNGGVVDSDDLRRGWLLRRIFHSKHIRAQDDNEDEESSPALGGSRGTSRGAPRAKWGARGISVSADEGVLDAEQSRSLEEHGIISGDEDDDARMQDPDELAMALDEDEDESSSAKKPAGGKTHASGIRGGDEWNDD